MPSVSSSTKVRLLDTAERLFAERGFEGVSIRDLSQAAGVNLAAVNYHFQGKENLYLAVLLRRLQPIRERVLEALARAAGEEGGRPALEGLIRAFVTTYLQEALTRPGGLMFLRLMARQMNDPRHGGQTFFQELIIPVHQALAGTLKTVLPDLDRERIAWIIASVVGQVMHFIMRWQRVHVELDQDQNGALPRSIFPPLAQPLDRYIQQVVNHVTRFSVGGIEEMARTEAGAP